MGEHDLELRVSDDERRAVDARLHAAVGEGRLTLTEFEERTGQVWAARTRGELAEAVRDLPVVAAVAAPVAVAGRARSWTRKRLVVVAAAVTLGGYGLFAATDSLLGDGALAVLSGATVQVGPSDGDVAVTALMGGAEVRVSGTGRPVQVDARTMMGGADILVGEPGGTLERTVRVRARAMMGGVTVVVPDGARAEVSGAMMMGGSSCAAACDGTGRVLVRVDARGAMGGVEVLTWSEAAAQGELDD